MDAKETGPAPDAVGNEPDAEHSHRNATDGRAAKQLVLGLFEQHRKEKLAQARALFIDILRQQGTATVEDVRRRMQIPDEYDPRWLGAVPGPLARRGIIRRVAYATAERAEAHARPIAVWEFLREPQPGGLDDIAGAKPAEGPPRPDGSGSNDAAEAPSPPDRPSVTAGAGPVFPEMRPPYRNPGDVGSDRAGRRRR